MLPVQSLESYGIKVGVIMIKMPNGAGQGGREMSSKAISQVGASGILLGPSYGTDS